MEGSLPFLIFLILQIILIYFFRKNLKENFFLLKVNIVWRIFNRQKFRKYKDNLDKEFNATVQKLVLERLKEEQTFKAKTDNKKPLTYFIKSHPEIDINFTFSFVSFFVAFGAILLQAEVGINIFSTVFGGTAALFFLYSTPVAIIQFIGILHKWRSQV